MFRNCLIFLLDCSNIKRQQSVWIKMCFKDLLLCVWKNKCESSQQPVFTTFIIPLLILLMYKMLPRCTVLSHWCVDVNSVPAMKTVTWIWQQLKSYESPCATNATQCFNDWLAHHFFSHSSSEALPRRYWSFSQFARAQSKLQKLP